MAKEDTEEKEVGTTESKESTPMFTPAEEKAAEKGWKPKEAWVAAGKDPEEWVSAGEFNRNAPLYEGLHKANKKNKDLEKKLNLLYQHQEELVKAKVEKQLEALKAAKKDAAKSNDVEKVVEIQDEIDRVKEEGVKAKKSAASDTDDSKEVFEDWKAENKWYDEDEDMAAFANGIGSKFEREHGPASDDPWTPAKILKEVAKRTNKAFEWKTKNPNRDTASKVGSKGNGGGATPSGGSRLPTYNDLPDEAKAAYKEFVKSKSNPYGIMSGEDYLRQYAIKAGTYKEQE